MTTARPSRRRGSLHAGDMIRAPRDPGSSTNLAVLLKPVREPQRPAGLVDQPELGSPPGCGRLHPADRPGRRTIDDSRGHRPVYPGLSWVGEALLPGQSLPSARGGGRSSKGARSLGEKPRPAAVGPRALRPSRALAASSRPQIPTHTPVQGPKRNGRAAGSDPRSAREGGPASPAEPPLHPGEAAPSRCKDEPTPGRSWRSLEGLLALHRSAGRFPSRRSPVATAPGWVAPGHASTARSLAALAHRPAAATGSGRSLFSPPRIRPSPATARLQGSENGWSSLRRRVSPLHRGGTRAPTRAW